MNKKILIAVLVALVLVSLIAYQYILPMLPRAMEIKSSAQAINTSQDVSKGVSDVSGTLKSIQETLS